MENQTFRPSFFKKLFSFGKFRGAGFSIGRDGVEYWGAPYGYRDIDYHRITKVEVRGKNLVIVEQRDFIELETVLLPAPSIVVEWLPDAPGVAKLIQEKIEEGKRMVRISPS